MTPTCGLLAPRIPPAALRTGEYNVALVMRLMRHIFLANLLGLQVMRESSLPLGVARSRWRHGFGWPHPRACRPSYAPPRALGAPPAESRSPKPSKAQPPATEVVV